MPKPYFYKKNQLEEIVRVDHAGEFGAQKIYEGQIAYSTDAQKATLKEMLDHELVHLQYFEDQVRQGKARPTIFLPIWRCLGYGLGALGRIAGYKYAMATTEAVEEVIIDHYQQQIDYLKKFHPKNSMLKNIQKFQSEEAGHIDIAVNYTDKQLPTKLFKVCVKKACYGAIKISKII